MKYILVFSFGVMLIAIISLIYRNDAQSKKIIFLERVNNESADYNTKWRKIIFGRDSLVAAQDSLIDVLKAYIKQLEDGHKKLEDGYKKLNDRIDGLDDYVDSLLFHDTGIKIYKLN